MEEWFNTHVRHHQAIIDAISATTGTQLPMRQIYPVSERQIDVWLREHQAMHDDMNGALSIAGNDLGQVDFKNAKQRESWFWTHFTQHRDVAGACGVPI